MTNRTSKTLLTLLVAASASCAVGDTLSLETLPGDPRFERINSRLPVRIHSDSGPLAQCPDDECMPVDFAAVIETYVCTAAVNATPRDFGTACSDVVAAIDRDVCVASELLTVAELAAPRHYVLYQVGDIGIDVPPQDAETNAELASLAIRIAGDVINEISRSLGSGGACTDTALARSAGAGTAPADHPLLNLTLAEELARFYEETLNIVESGSELAGVNGAAVSEVELSRATDLAEGARSALSIAASRTAAAHALVGGRGGLSAIPGVATEGFFTRRPPTGEARAALDLFRAAAIDPALVNDPAVTIDQLVAGGGGVAEADSVRFRIGLFQGRAALAAAATAGLAYDYLGVGRAGFTQARDYLREELRAFDRLPDVELPAETFGDGTTTDAAGVVLYAATRVPPSQLPPSYWAAVLRYDPTPALYSPPRVNPTAWVWEPTVSGALPHGHAWGDFATVGNSGFVTGDRTAASILQQAVGRGAGLVSRLCGGTGTCTDETDPLDRAGAIFARALARFGGVPGTDAGTGASIDVTRYETATYVGQARACLYQNSPGVFSALVGVTGPFTVGDLRLVRGREGLECAVRGMLESVPCSASQLDALTGLAWGPLSGGVLAAAVGNLVFGRPGPESTALFVVRRRAGATGSAPGEYEEVTGFVLAQPPASAVTNRYRYCTTHPIVPGLEHDAAELVAPDPSGEPGAEEYCVGLPRSLRIPLENELTSDGTPDESSWRHYLELATRASAEADALGEDLVRTGLEMDLRAEAANDELSRLCGTRINLTSITSALATTDPVDSGSPPCDPPYVASGARCVLDPLLYAVAHADEDEDLRRLADCVGADVVPLATLGDRVLCVWDTTPDGPQTGLCEGATGAMPCPYAANGDGTCPTVDSDLERLLPMGLTPIPVSERMFVFSRPVETTITTTETLDLPCEELARLRAGDPTERDAAGLGLPSLTYEVVSDLARQLTWEPVVGDYSVVRYAGAQVFGTGSITGGAGSLWPMFRSEIGMTMPPSLVPGRPDGGICPLAGYDESAPAVAGWTGPLFCLGGLAATASGPNGTARGERARMNDLLARAVFAVRAATGLDLGDSILPYNPDTGFHQFCAEPSAVSCPRSGSFVPGFTYEPLTPGGPAFCASDGRLFVDERNGDPDNGGLRPVSDFASSACVIDGASTGCDAVTGSIPAGAEWARCPYEGGPCIVFNDLPGSAGDCDDGTAPDNDLPLLFRAPEDGIADGNSLRNASVGFATFDFWYRIAGSATPDSLTRGIRGYEAGFINYGGGGSGATSSRNRALPRGDAGPLTYADFLNGVELACVAARQGIPVSDTRCTAPSNITNLGEALRMARYLECRSNEINERNASALFIDLPRSVVDALRDDGLGLYGSGSGEVDAEVSEVRAAFLELSTNRNAIAADMRGFAASIRRLRSEVATSSNMRQIERLTLLSGTLDRMTQCMTAVTSIATTDGAEAAGRGAAAAITCANSIGQILIAGSISRLRAANIDETLIQQFADFDEQASQIAGAMATRATSIRAALERIDAALGRLRANQRSARSALARAVGFTDPGTDDHNEVNSVYRARYSTALARYRAAHRRAVRAAFIARIALEQRLGMSLADIEDDLFSDEPPREWVDTICTLPSIDYDTLRGTITSEGDEAIDRELLAPDGYAGAFVGDYVRRLEDVFESYSFVHPFQAGTDTAVISLRDDVLGVRAECDVPSPNLVLNGGRLNRLADTERGGWEVVGCDPEAVPEPPSGRANRACVSITALPGADTSENGGMTPTGTVLGGDFGTPPEYRVTFGGSDAWSDAVRFQQRVAVGPGRYRLSWFARTVDGEIHPTAAVTASGAGVSLASATVFPTTVSGESGAWNRYWVFVDVARDTELVVSLGGGLDMVPTDQARIDVTGVMLEVLDAAGLRSPGSPVEDPASPDEPDRPFGDVAEPPPFIESGDFGTRVLRACADTDGRWFRADAFVPGCVRTCADGYDGRCAPEFEEVRCYREIGFDVSADELQELLVDGDAGFAAGNFNYRIESVAVNLVGENLRDCERTGGSSGCYASGSLSYSILHGGPYVVRNALGALYEAPLFPGRIESARALAAERYLTNPLSSADRGLIEPYTRVELRGRPLDGTLALRIWDDPTFVFENLEDIQVVLTYRYWTHQR